MNPSVTKKRGCLRRIIFPGRREQEWRERCTVTNRLPPLNTLRVFKSVMLHKSIKLVADELCITPQAVIK